MTKRGEPLLSLVMKNGQRLRPPQPLADDQAAAAKRELERLPEPLRRLDPDATYPVEVASELLDLAAEVDRRLQQNGAQNHDGSRRVQRSATTASSSWSTCRTISVPAARWRCRAATRSSRSSIVSPARFRNVVLTQDWHPRGHPSFASTHPGKKPFETITAPYGPQVLWPDHCVQDNARRGVSQGARHSACRR